MINTHWVYSYFWNVRHIIARHLLCATSPLPISTSVIYIDTTPKKSISQFKKN